MINLVSLNMNNFVIVDQLINLIILKTVIINVNSVKRINDQINFIIKNHIYIIDQDLEVMKEIN